MSCLFFAAEVQSPSFWGIEFTVACGLSPREKVLQQQEGFIVKITLTKKKHGWRVLSNSFQEADKQKGYSAVY